eukprot:gnl/TRDRNA2_/TRDRNA2_177131_c0_seq10.p1 gnl/TRDRNA2_/TRDRNA2_177131_c0~~gnl/TRDRNA2_/TRDRNA2_177131_c0_seq10.p1  ORF type:complete len:134 (+),score=41.02 gnl/TRDRNA2_/TRDRNA2_177131_c0_seq10:89-490(+)
MQSIRLLLLAVLVVSAAGSRIRAKRQRLNADINQKVYIDGSPVFGDGAGEDAMNQCQSLAPSQVASPDSPVVKVCGTSIKATFYLRNKCQGYYEHYKEIGSCDTGAPPTTCETMSPAQDERFSTYQSYKIEPC